MLLLFSVSGFAQLPKIPADCENNYVAYLDNYNVKAYDQAYPYWQKVIRKCPEIRKSLHINGEKILKEMINIEADGPRREALIDSLFWLYELRGEIFGRRPYISIKKASAILKYRQKNYPVADTLLRFACDSLDTGSPPSGLKNYLHTSKLLFTSRSINKAELAERIAYIWILIDRRRSKPEEGDRQIEQLLLDLTHKAMICDELDIIFGQRLLSEPLDNKVLLQLINSYISKGCSDRPIFQEGIDKAQSSGALTIDLIQALAKLEESTGNYRSAIKMLQNIENLEEPDPDKAELYYQIAINYYKLSNFRECRTNAKLALGLNPKMGKAYLLIGDAYAASRSECAEGLNNVTIRAVYWLAEDMFIKAKEVDPSVADQAKVKIAAAREQFPGSNDVFMAPNVSVGDSYPVGCWIKEKTTVKVRD